MNMHNDQKLYKQANQHLELQKIFVFIFLLLLIHVLRKKKKKKGYARDYKYSYIPQADTSMRTDSYNMVGVHDL